MAHDDKHDAHGDHEQHIAHTMSVGMLLAVFGALMVFTVLTVWVAQQGLGSQTSFMIAMTIATVKAGLVMAIFMHLWWDKRLNLFVFVGSFLFVVLFLGMSLADKAENTPDIHRLEADQAAQAAAK